MAARAPDAAADLAFVNGRVAIMDRPGHVAQAVAVRDGRLIAVGSDADVRPAIGARTRRVDLRGRSLLPGFQDAHVHPVMAGVGLIRCPLHQLPPTGEAYLAAIGAYAAAHPDAAWILGDGWYMSAFPGGTPTRHELDRVVPDRPAFFINRDGHGAWLNSRALAVAGIQATTPDPPHGRIERDADGTPSGTLHEGAMEMVKALLPPPSLDERARGLLLAQAYLHRLGVTAWQDAWVTPEDQAAYELIAGRGQLTARAIACQWWEREDDERQIEAFVERRARGAIGRLRAGTVKIMQDGVAENYTAAMLTPYLDGDGRPTANRGLSFVEPEALKGYVIRLDALGFQVHFHALGDRAVREALDAVQAARAANGPSDTRPHLAHLQVVDPADFPRFAALDATANIQPYWACLDPQMVDLTLPFLPPERAALQYPFRSLRDAGARLAGGSDWTVSTPNVLAEAEVAVDRISPEYRDRPPFLPAQALAPFDALAAFTTGTAYLNHLEAVTGTLEPGKLADLVVLDRDVFGPAVGRLGDIKVLLTLVEGQVVHEAPELEAA